MSALDYVINPWQDQSQQQQQQREEHLMFKTIVTAAVMAGVASIGLGAVATTAYAGSPSPIHKWHVVQYDSTRAQCANEDGPGPCYWDAGRMGNGNGDSYWIDRAQWVHYVDGRTFPLD